MKAPQRKDFPPLRRFFMANVGIRAKRAARSSFRSRPIQKKPPDLAPGDFAAHAKFRLLLLPSGPDKIHGMASHETRWSSIRRQFILYHAFSGIASPILRGDGKARICLGLMRLPALTRRCAALLYMIVDRGPAQCRVWPVAAPAEAFVRAGAGLRGAWGSDMLAEARAGISVQSSLHYGRWRLQGRFPYAAFCGSCEVCLGRYAVMRAFGVLRCGSVGGGTPVMRFYRSVLRSITPVCGSVEVFCVQSRLLFAA